MVRASARLHGHPSSVVSRLGRNTVLPMHRICAGSTEIVKELVATPLQL
jgi:hypothetical protein